MKFPWDKYVELPLERRNTLQIFITNTCNLVKFCDTCFVRNIIKENNNHMDISEYTAAVKYFLMKGGQQINLLGG